MPCIPETNIQILEKLQIEKQQGVEPIKAGEYILGFYQDASAFLPEHFARADMLKAAELGLIRPEEFRKNATKFGWELWEKPLPETPLEDA